MRLVSQPIPRLLGRGSGIAQTVGLDNESDVGPVEVDLKSVHLALGLGQGKPGFAGDRQESALELRVGERERLPIERLPKSGNARPAIEAAYRRSERLGIRQVALVGFVDRRLQPIAWPPTGDVDERAHRLTGIRSSVVTSSGTSVTRRWTKMPVRRRSPGAGTVTSIRPGLSVPIPHSAAALSWLRTASGPQLSNAAVQRPYWVI